MELWSAGSLEIGGLCASPGTAGWLRQHRPACTEAMSPSMQWSALRRCCSSSRPASPGKGPTLAPHLSSRWGWRSLLWRPTLERMLPGAGTANRQRSSRGTHLFPPLLEHPCPEKLVRRQGTPPGTRGSRRLEGIRCSPGAQCPDPAHAVR